MAYKDGDKAELHDIVVVEDNSGCEQHLPLGTELLIEEIREVPGTGSGVVVRTNASDEFLDPIRLRLKRRKKPTLEGLAHARAAELANRLTSPDVDIRGQAVYDLLTRMVKSREFEELDKLLDVIDVDHEDLGVLLSWVMGTFSLSDHLSRRYRLWDRVFARYQAEKGDVEAHVVLDRLRTRYEKLQSAVSRIGFSVMQTSGEWSIHDVSEHAKRMEEADNKVLHYQYDLIHERKALRAALEKVAAWDLPATGRTWPDGDKMSYEACFGTNGSRDYFKDLARQALDYQPSVESIDYHDVKTHRDSWRSAIVIARDTSPSDDNSDRSYWEHELKAFDRTFELLEDTLCLRGG